MAKSKRAAAGAASNKRARTAADTAEAAADITEQPLQQQQQQQDLPKVGAVEDNAPAPTSSRRRNMQTAAKPPAATSSRQRGTSVKREATTVAGGKGEAAAAAETDAAKSAKVSKAAAKVKSGDKTAATAPGKPRPAAESQVAEVTKPEKSVKVTKAAAKAKSGAVVDKPKPPFYLIKSEPHEFSWDDLQARPNQTEGWEGVRNYVARNHLRAMELGDRAFFYHSSCKTPGIVGIVEVVRESYPDLTAQQKSSKYYDPKATPEDPRWSMVDFKLVRNLARPITLEELKGHKGGALSSMALFTTARLSVQPVSRQEWDFVLGLEQQEAP